MRANPWEIPDQCQRVEVVDANVAGRAGSALSVSCSRLPKERGRAVDREQRRLFEQTIQFDDRVADLSEWEALVEGLSGSAPTEHPRT